MMSRGMLGRVGSIAALCLLIAAPAHADRITAGVLLYPGIAKPIDIELQSDTLVLDGFASPFSGIFNPRFQCTVPTCLPGTNVNLLTHFSGGDLSGTATVDGRTFNTIGSLSSLASMSATWTGSLAIPQGYQGGPLTAPFTFTGVFSYEVDPTAAWRNLTLFGSGTATATFRPYGVPEFAPALFLESIRYDFEAAATPEPGSMILVGSALAGLLAARARRKRSRQRP